MMNQNKVIQLNPSQCYEDFEGWGTSLAWWGHAIGSWSQENMEKVADLVFDVDKGLGLNIVRYNIGGGENPAIEHNTLRPGGDVPGFQPKEGQWDWEADQGQRRIMLAGIERGVDIVEGFSNSPPYWMTKSGSVTGAVDGGNNLKDEYYQAFADYLSAVVLYYKEKHGVIFRTLNPLNEPISSWWKQGNIQEGCHFTREKQEKIIDELYQSFRRNGITTTTISASDENSINETIEVMGKYTHSTMEKISQVNTHSYNGDQLTEVRALADKYGKKLWMSEYGTGGSAPHSHEDMTSVMELANRIIQDLRILRPAAWIYWQAVEDEGANNNWGFIHADFVHQEEYEQTKQYYAMLNFSRFIRPGSRIIITPTDQSIAAYDEGTKRLTIVVQNNQEQAEEIGFELSGFTWTKEKAQIYETTKTKNFQETTIALASNGFRVKVDGISVTTIVLDDVTINE